MGDFQSEVTKSEKFAKSKKTKNVLVNILAKCRWIQDFYTSLESSYYKLKFMHIWQSDSLENVSHMVHEMAILFCYCLGPFVVGNSKIEKSAKLLFSISWPNLNGF